MKKALLLPFFTCLHLVVFSQSFGEIHGRIIDDSGNPLPFANVIAYQGEKPIGTTANELGKFKIKPLNPGIYSLEISFIGYHQTSIREITVNPDEIRFLGDLKLIPNEVVISDDALVITYRDKLIDPEETSKITMRSGEIARSPMAKNPVGLVASMLSDVSQKPGTEELYFRGARSSSILYLIDGQKITSGIGRFPGGAIGSISVYTGGLPAKFGDTTGGVVVIETKNYFDFYNERKAQNSR